MLFKLKEANTYASTSDTDLAFDKLVEDIISNKSNIWTSSEEHENYLLHGGKGCCKAVFAKLQKHFDDKLVVFSTPGLSSLLVFRDTVPSVFKLVDNNDDDGMIQNISKAINKECKNLVHDKNKCTIWVDKQTWINSVSATIISLLENLSDDPWFKLPSIVIGNIITSAVTNQPTPLQIELGVLGKKSLVQQFYDPGICCSYDKLLRFKASAAVAASNKTQLTGFQSSVWCKPLQITLMPISPHPMD